LERDVQGKWRWLLYLIVAWQFFRTTVSAFSVPWNWTLDQCLFLFFAACVIFASGFWALIWLRGGADAVKERWSFNQQQNARSLNKKFFLWSLLFWIAVAIALVLLFNFLQH